MVSEDPFAILENAVRKQEGETQSQRLLAAARVQLILGRNAKSVFFASLVLRLTPRVDWECETMATDGRTLCYCPKFVLGLSPDELVGVLAHEALHCALAHPYRRGSRDSQMWNIACDLAVNCLLSEAGFVLPQGRLIPGEGKYQAYDPLLSADEYYRLLATSQDPDPGNDTPISDPGGCGQVIDPQVSDPAANREQESEWTVALAQARQAAQARGELPRGLCRAVCEAIHPRADWKSLLRAFVSEHAKNDYSWLRPNRRMISRGLYLPSVHSENLGEVVLAVDTSGSIGDELLERFASEIQGILDAYFCTVTLLYHDSQIQGVQTWCSTDGPLKLEPVGGGGTDHASVFDWLEEHDVEPACVICLTDLETTFPEYVPHMPVLWAVHGRERNAPFGLVIPLND